MALKENYKNYIPDTQGRRYIITQDAQGYSKIQDATQYTQEGDNFGANDINATNVEVNKLMAKTTSALAITIPADDGSNYTQLTDKDGLNYYYIDIAVTGMTQDFVGSNVVDPVLIDPNDTTNFSISDMEETLNSYMPLIMQIRSMNGQVRVFMYDLPDRDFDVYLYGV